MRLSRGRFGMAPLAIAPVHRTGAGDAIESVDQVVHRDLALGVDAGDLTAIEHIEPVDDRVNMKNVVIDKHRRFARLLDGADEFERLAGFGQRQAHGGLVEDDEFGLEMERPRDRHALLLAARHRGHDIVGMHRRGGEAHMLAHQPRRFRAHPLDVKETPAGARLAPHEHVAPDRLLLAQRPLLVDGLNAEAAGPRDRPVVDPASVKIDLASRVRPMEAHHGLHQRRLAGAVVAEQADDLAAIDSEIHPRERPHFAERLRDVAKLDHRRVVGPGGSCHRRSIGLWGAPRRGPRPAPRVLENDQRISFAASGATASTLVESTNAPAVLMSRPENRTSWSGRC